MFVKLFDEQHERDLEIRINDFLSYNKDIKLFDIKYAISTIYDEREQIYCFSAMIIYEKI